MATGDLKVIGPQASWGHYIAASGTAIEAGEPVHRVGMSYTTGTTDVNEMVLAAADTPTIGTHEFGGIAIVPSLNVAAGTTEAQFLNCARPVPHVGRIRGKAETSTTVDTLSELQGVIGDAATCEYNATGASDGGQLYTIALGAADTDGGTIVGGNFALAELEITIDARCYRADITA